MGLAPGPVPLWDRPAGPRDMGWILPAAVLAAAALLFHRQVLFDPGTAIPWDLAGFHLPIVTAYAGALREGVLPLWEPYAGCGRPLLADPQTAVFYPAIFLAALFGRAGLLYRIEAVEVLHVFLAGFFTYLLARRIGLDRGPALLAGLMFELGGFMASQLQHLGSICGAPWLVLAWLALFLPAGWRIPALALALTLSFFCGYTALTVMTGASALLLALLLWASGRAGWKVVLSVPLAGLLAAGLAAVQLLPSLELASHSVGQYRSEWLTGFGLPPAALVSLVSPNYWGIFDLRTYRAPYDLTLLYLYSSGLGLALALLALFRRLRYTAVFASLAALCGLLMLGEFTPAGRFLFAALPVFLRNTVYWHLFMAAFLLALALLAGCGAQAWLRRPHWTWAACAVAALDLLAVGSGRPMNTQRIAEASVIGENSIDGSRETFNALQAAADDGRYDTVDDTVTLPNSAPLMRLRSASGYNPLALERLIQVRLGLARGRHWGAYYPVENLASPAAGTMSIRALTSRRELPPERLRGTSWLPFARLPGRTLYRNPGAPPRYRIVGRVRAAAGLEESARLLRDPAFRPAVEAVAEGFQLDSGAQGAVRVVAEYRQHIVLDTDTTAAAYLATSEAHYPGWTATVDGRPAPVYYTNAAFRGVPVPAGRHRVEFRFRSPALARGVWLSAVALSIGSLLVLRARRAQR